MLRFHHISWPYKLSEKNQINVIHKALIITALHYKLTLYGTLYG